MAVVDIYAPLNMYALQPIFGFVDVATYDRIVVSRGDDAAEYVGDFYYNDIGEVFGTVDSVSLAEGGRLLFDASGLDFPANILQTYIESGWVYDAFAEVLTGADTISGSLGADAIAAFGGHDEILADEGDDYIDPGVGEDFIDGGSGVDTVAFEGLFRDYEIDRAGATLYVEDVIFSETDELFSVERLEFEDGTLAFDAGTGEYHFHRPGEPDGDGGAGDDFELASAKVGDIEVAAATYQFFTGIVPTAAGFEYLIFSPNNPADLNDPYYEQFNQENRYINFANNLGSFGEGREEFAAEFGNLTFEETVRTAFEDIIGSGAVVENGGNPEASIDFFLNARAYYEAVALERVVSSGVSLEQATKVVAIGSILNEATKAGVGDYAEVIDELVADLRDDGTSNLLGQDLFAIA